MYGPSSFMVDDYTAERERERGRERRREREREREKSFCMFFPITSRSALQHREKKKYCMRKKNFLNFIVCVCVCVCVFVCVCVCVYVCVCVFVCVFVFQQV